MLIEKPRSKRNVNGILLLDKPREMSSSKAVQLIKSLLSAKKAGHTGTLDLLADGMLPICLGEATKFSQFLLNADKYYRVKAKLGIKTTTGDTEGEIIAEKPISPLTTTQLALETLFKRFQGEISQIPPMFSAIKQNGVPLYQLARKGLTIERESRKVTIHSLDLIAQTNDTFTLDIKCTKGTYIRTLIEDMGDVLGCGAHVMTLRRLGVANYSAEKLVSFDTLNSMNDMQREAILLPVDTAIDHWPVLYISEAAAFYLMRGQAMGIPRTPSYGFVRLLIKNTQRFVGVGEIGEDGRVIPRRLVATG